MSPETVSERRKRIMSARQALHFENMRVLGAHFSGRANFKKSPSNIDPLLLELSKILEENAGLIADICRKAGVSRAAVQRWMHKGTDPKLTLLRAVLNVTGYEIVIVKKDNRNGY